MPEHAYFLQMKLYDLFQLFFDIFVHCSNDDEDDKHKPEKNGLNGENSESFNHYAIMYEAVAYHKDDCADDEQRFFKEIRLS